MPLLPLSPVAISFFLLAAHFMHAQQMVGVGAALAMIAMLAIRKPWVIWWAQIALVFGSMAWMYTALMLVQERQAMGQPYTRLLIILGTVALANLLSCLAFRAGRVKSYYKHPSDAA